MGPAYGLTAGLVTLRETYQEDFESRTEMLWVTRVVATGEVAQKVDVYFTATTSPCLEAALVPTFVVDRNAAPGWLIGNGDAAYRVSVTRGEWMPAYVRRASTGNCEAVADPATLTGVLVRSYYRVPRSTGGADLQSYPFALPGPLNLEVQQ